MATESNSTTDKGLGVALACAAVVAVGAVLMITGAPDIEAAWGFAAAMIFSAIAIVAIHLWG
ncbi:hypothetical protein G6M89_01055 [Natronolimnobius sp. AArcel1]|uniref:DUF7525 family protein n=1 Tax=Natronolimnobius sp. AArcel1 TaxID=1679093 RepID=UPI0013EB0471|nr:hypothetical protein [Natronolimnobius sp. AArcel1]NGM67607.1 hypothetical protein [Natronolimnobius sp. AArcel1]